MPDMPTNEEMAREARDILIRSRCGTWHALLHDDLQNLTFFRDTLEELIRSAEAREIDSLSAKQRTDLADHYPYWWQDIIGDRFRASFLIAVLSVTEFNLGRLCTDVAAVAQTPITQNDLKGGSIFEQSRKFLSLFAKFAQPPEARWAYIRDLYSIRNCLIHRQGMIDGHSSAAPIRSFIARNAHITDQSGFIQIQPAFGIDAHAEVVAFFEELRGELVGLCERAATFSA